MPSVASLTALAASPPLLLVLVLVLVVLAAAGAAAALGEAPRGAGVPTLIYTPAVVLTTHNRTLQRNEETHRLAAQPAHSP